ncbi:thioredoxin family protein [Pseudonocardia oceani]|uniref:thioredoxin family protein n=1 Tax=Pseudonocardia oceani TaxID=2792013 RepID=UPI0027E34D91|nr:thioredoxin domain-containing protein [Pseudonocardia oceani]
MRAVMEASAVHDTTSAGVLTEVGDATFDRQVRTGAGPVLVEFFATWCGNCRRFAPTLQQVAAEYADRVPVVTVNADENPELVRRYGISSTPTLVLIEGGEPIGTLVGAQPAQAVRDLLDPVLAQSAGAGAASPAPSGSWVPADACTLPTAEQPLRVAEFHTLFATALRRLERREPGLRLVLAGDPSVEASARELIARESMCCSFFDFQLTPAGGELQLDVRVPDARVDVLDGITSQAHAAGSRS